MKISEISRLIVPPPERFAGPQHAFELKRVMAGLRAEEHPGQKGHRQMTLLQQGAVTMAVFAIEDGGVLAGYADHRLVAIQIIDGDFAIEMPETSYFLEADSLLVLQPVVCHSAAGALLLTVKREPSP